MRNALILTGLSLFVLAGCIASGPRLVHWSPSGGVVEMGGNRTEALQLIRRTCGGPFDVVEEWEETDYDDEGQPASGWRVAFECDPRGAVPPLVDVRQVEFRAETIEDRDVHLIWERYLGELALSQDEAARHCEALIADGSADWRLPRIAELDGIHSYLEQPATVWTDARVAGKGAAFTSAGELVLLGADEQARARCVREIR